jgi:MFS family permease
VDHGIKQEKKSLWHNKDYLILWSGQIVSSTGSRMSLLAFPLLVLALSRSPAQAGFTGALRALPYLIFSLPAGALLDRWDRKRVMIVCDTGRALSLASLAFAFVLGHLTVLQVNIVSLIEGTLFVFFNIAEIACLPNVVNKEQLPAATAQNEGATYTTALVGPALCGILYSIHSILPFLVDAVSYIVSVISLLFIKIQFQQEYVVKQRKLWLEIREGLGWLWHQPLIWFLAFFCGGINLLAASYTLRVIVLAQRLHASSITIGLILASGGCGGVFGAFIAPRIQKRWSFGQVMVAIPCLWALLTVLYVLAPNPIILGIISFSIYTMWPIFNTVQISYRLALIPDTLQGRVNSVYRLIAFSSEPLGLALAGFLLQIIGINSTIMLIAAGFALLALLARINTHVHHAQPLRGRAT